MFCRHFGKLIVPEHFCENILNDCTRVRLTVVSRLRWRYCNKLWIGIYQAAASWGLIPSMNCTPAMTSGRKSEPLSNRQRLAADSMSL